MMKKLIIAAAAAMLSIFSAGNAYAAGCNLNHAKILDTIKNQKPKDLLFIVAHRGIHGTINSDQYKLTPENTRESLDNADKECIEAVEIDVRLSSDSVPMITHDANWGRELRVPNGDGTCCYNPYTNVGGNPAVGSTTAAQAAQWVARPTTNFWASSKYNERGTTLNDMLNHYQQKGYEFLIFIDVKDSPAFGKVWAEVAAHQMGDRVVIKFGAKVFPRPQVLADKLRTIHWHCQCALSDAAYINVMPVFQTSDIGPSPELGQGGGEAQVVAAAQAWADWNAGHSGEHFVVGVETNIKQRGAILKDTILAIRDKVSVANFMPVIEDATTNTGSYFRSNGSCCAFLSEYYFLGKPYGLPSDTDDERPFIDFVKDHVTGNYINVITTDNALLLAQQAQQWGRRNTLKYFR